ncbi:MAG: magnesium/cobalt transporter CorA [Acidimicrobiales bacterium]
MIAVRAYANGGGVDVLDPADIAAFLDRKEGVLWVDVSEPSEDDLTCVQEQFSLHPLAMEDVREPHQRPKLEQYPTHAFIVARSAELAEVDFFLGRSWLVTVREADHRHTAWPVEKAHARFERTHPDPPTVGFLLYVLLDDLVDGYYDHVDKAEDRLEELEESIFSEELPDELNVQRELFDARRKLLEFRRSVVPLREVVSSLLRGEVEWLDDYTLTHLQDVYDHVLRAVDQLDSWRELMGNAVDAHLAMIANRQNRVMKKMTSWGAILFASTLVAGIYGMNFERMPELRWHFGFWYALGVMATVTVLLYMYFRNKDWL